MFDINQLADEAATKHDAGTVVHLTNPDDSLAYYEKDGKTLPVTITVAGDQSAVYRRAEKAQRAQKLKSSSFTGQKMHDDALERAVACTLAWEGLSIGGQLIPFNPANVRMVYTKAKWIYDAVNEAIHDPKRFFESGSTQQPGTSDTSPS